jgi:hypothetical protein
VKHFFDRIRLQRQMAWLCACLMAVAMLAGGCQTSQVSETEKRPDLPYYVVLNPLVSYPSQPTVEDLYKKMDGAVIVSWISGPQYYKGDQPLVPGSEEEAQFLKAGIKPGLGFYEYSVRIVQVVDDRLLHVQAGDTIKIRSNIVYAEYDPFHLYLLSYPQQHFLLSLFKGDLTADKSYFYNNFLQYYEVNGYMFSTVGTKSFDRYSGLTAEKFALVLKGIERVSQ